MPTQQCCSQIGWNGSAPRAAESKGWQNECCKRKHLLFWAQQFWLIGTTKWNSINNSYCLYFVICPPRESNGLAAGTQLPLTGYCVYFPQDQATTDTYSHPPTAEFNNKWRYKPTCTYALIARTERTLNSDPLPFCCSSFTPAYRIHSPRW
jgi:hypothetical protein